MGNNLKIKKMWNLVVSNPENHNLWLKTAIEIEFQIGRENKHSFFADTELQVEKVKEKAMFNRPFFVLKSNFFECQNDHKFSNKKLDATI